VVVVLELALVVLENEEQEVPDDDLSARKAKKSAVVYNIELHFSYLT
jgi:hypothetical protein